MEVEILNMANFAIRGGVMSVGDNIRSSISRVETALRDAGTENAVRSIVDVLKDIAQALDEVEKRAKRAGRE
jgi:hypothetical protein